MQRLPEPGSADDYLPLLLQLLNQYGGYLCRIGQVGTSDLGGTFLLFWGAPTSYENDLNRAFSFLLDLRTQLRIPLRAGVTYAVVYAGFVGSPLSEEYTCYGSRVNQALRHMTAAEWGQILLDENTAQRGKEDFDVTVVGEFGLKGLTGRQPLFALQARRSVRIPTTPDARSSSSADLLFVGRNDESAELHATLAPIFAGRFAGFALVSGEAGIGKSRFVDEVLRTYITSNAPQSLQIFLCQTDEILRESLNPFRYFLRRYFDQTPGGGDATNKENFARQLDALIAATSDAALATELERTRSFLGALINLHWPDSLHAQLDPQLRFENTLIALKMLILAECRRLPVILLIEDSHWLDEDSHAFLALLTRNVEDYPFAVVATARSQEETTDPVLSDIARHEIRLTSLTNDDIAALAGKHLGGPAAPELMELLMSRAEGNPFFAEQMLLYLQEQVLLVAGEDGWQLANDTSTSRMTPEDVQSVLIARLDRLAQAVKEVVQTAAVLGREFSVHVLSQMLHGDTMLDKKVQSAHDAAVWSALSELRYLFKHALLRDAAYEMQLRIQLRTLHQTAAEAIEHLYAENLTLYYPDLVYHYHHAELVDKERLYAELAGREASAQFANRDAVAFFTRALELTPDDALNECYMLRTQLQEVFKLQGDLTVQQQNLEEMAALAISLGNLAYQAQVHLAYTEFYIGTSDYPAAVTAVQRTIELAEQVDDVLLQTRGYEQWGRALWPQAKYQEAEVMALKALTLAQEAGLRQSEASVLIVQGIALWYLGKYDAAQQVLEQSRTVYDEIDMPFSQAPVLVNLALIAQNLGDHRGALAYLTQAQRIYQDIGARQGQAMTATNMGISYQNLGDYLRAIDTQRQALIVFREVGDRFGQIVALANLGSIAMNLGNYGTSRVHLTDALTICRDIGSIGQEAGLLAILSEIDLVEGYLDEAYPKAQEAVEIATGIDHPGTAAKAHVKLGKVLLALKKLDEAVVAFDNALTIRRELNEIKRSMEAHAGLAQCALLQDDLVAARSHAEEIMAFLETDTLDGALDPFTIYLSCYRVLSTIHDVRALALIEDAHAHLQEQAVQITDGRLRQSFLENVASNREIVREYINSRQD